MEIATFMTPCPYTIDAGASIDEAIRIMQQRDVRHLPVIEEDGLVGVVSLRDLNVAMFICESTKFIPSVKDVCNQEPLVFRQDSNLADVAETISKSKQDCVLIADTEGNFVGIFTTTDACHAIHLLMAKK